MEELQVTPRMGTIQKTLITTRLFEAYWDRWIAHGLDRQVVTELRPKIKSLEDWVNVWNENAGECVKNFESEYLLRLASLRYNLIQWIYPESCDEKRKWFTSCKELFQQADELSPDPIVKKAIQIDGVDCFGRIRTPVGATGCVIIINPIDSSKEELFTYELDFASKGLATVSFDGPGQGETYVYNGLKATSQRWDLFVNQVINYTSEQFPNLPIYLFGTSSGATWAIHGGFHPKVSKVISVSPALHNDVIMPEYFIERLSYISEDIEGLLPKHENYERCCPVFLFHGKKDVMVRDEDLYDLYNKLPQGKRLIEYEDEGHCCNSKLSEIRKIAAEWLLGGVGVNHGF